VSTLDGGARSIGAPPSSSSAASAADLRAGGVSRAQQSVTPAGSASEESRSSTAAPQGPPIPIPERPRLASNVELVGEMVESAFETPPWLLSRDGRYVQVSRLLYSVAEQADGERSVEEIARAVSEAIKRDVTADDVRVIVGNLMRSGIIALPEGAAQGSVQLAPDQGSPLALRMKMRMLSPRVIDPVTALLQFLYWPPVLVLALAAAAAVEVWVYFSHGVGQSIHAAFYTPGLMLAVFGIVVLAAAFHELGHAAALRFGGARARAMGVGLYIVYPAFYTDVTENYRLPRWARVRTDLGGFYFNLLFILALMGIYALTGLEFLILLVVILNLEIIHQTLPFIRLDGYWALADVTGVPDFFSQIVPFLRAHLPAWVPLPEGRKLPELKTWGKFVFGTYILVTVPLLIFLLFTMLRAAPRLIATAVDALGFQVGTIGKSAGAGDVVMILAAIAQIFALALPLLGIVYTLVTLARRLFGAIWRWSSPTPARRVMGAAMSAAIVAAVALLWAPELPLPGAPAGPLYAATAPFTPIQAQERWTFADIAVQQGSVGHPNVVIAPSAEPGASPGASAEPAAGGGAPAASAPPAVSAAPAGAGSPAPASEAPADALPTPAASPEAGPACSPAAAGSPLASAAPSAQPSTCP
jgi:putative peptide zinc metalloprotease protein